MMVVYEFLINMVMVLGAIAAAFFAAKVSLKVLVYLIRLAIVMAVVATRAYAAAKAEAELPVRDLAFDFDGNKADTRRFNTIVKDRLVRTWVAAQHGDLAIIATHFGRRLAKA